MAHLATIETETERYRYIGGTRNLDGSVSRTVGVNADTPQDARERIAQRLTQLNKKYGNGQTVTAEEIGLVRREAADTPRGSVGR